jgi:hypothetical protein
MGGKKSKKPKKAGPS